MKRNFIIPVLTILICNVAFAQQPVMTVPKPNWYNLDLKQDGVFGVSVDKAYRELLMKKKAFPVIVAVIDGGLDLNHEDIKNVVWTNLKEIPDNGLDDDKNGYVDDVHGWNFLGSSKDSFEYGNDLLILQLRNYKSKFKGKDSANVSLKDQSDYKTYQAKRSELNEKLKKINQDIQSIGGLLTDLNAILKKMAKENPNPEDFEKFIASNAAEANARQFIIAVLKKNPDFKGYLNQTKELLEKNRIDSMYRFNMYYDPRGSQAAEFTKNKGRFYGNPNVYGAVPPAHGTHVAGIIGAQRNNNLGTNGVADHVLIMPIRAIPDGHAPGKDQANAIRYAADNGARVINMSFGLGLETDSDMVKEAVDYALSKDILFVGAAGNSHRNLDNAIGFPNRLHMADRKFTDVFIKVGASGFIDDDQLAVPFSNYGESSVDVFAPGLAINSTVPGNKYEAHSGTSMAAPIVSGLAAVIRAYYPKLTARQVKEIIMKSVVKRDALKKLCISGGVVNAYQALLLARNY